MKITTLTAAALTAVCALADEKPAYLDTSLTFEERAADLVSRMTLEEKTGQLGRNTIAVPRLGVAKYDYWNEALHGIQNGTGEGTSFPMPLSLAQTWDEDFIREVASAISDECRGHNQSPEEGGRGRGLTYWCPTINLGRHPLWGRTNEAYGEDAYVAGQLASAFVEGMKGDDAKYLKTVPTIKHYALNNHENQRGSTSSDASEADIRDYYARVYRYVVERTDVPSLMSAYNAVNYTPSSANPFLLTTLLRETFGFTGFVVSDCGAIDNIERQQRWRPTRNTVQKGNFRIGAGRKLADYVDDDGIVTKPGSVAMALMAGCNMDCNGDIYPKQSRIAHKEGLLGESVISLNAYHNLLARFKLGEFDPYESVAYRGDKYTFANTVETAAHRALADEAAARSVVLLKNDDDILPLNAKKLRRLVIVGEGADVCFLGNYCGKPKEKNCISVYAGISDYLYVNNPRTELKLVTAFGEDGAIRDEDKAAIEAADAVLVMCADQHDDSSEGHDREVLRLFRNQAEIARNVAAINPDTIVFLQTSNVVELDLFKDRVKAIFWSSQNGQGQGVGVARQIFGETNPSGKLTFSWYAKESEIPGIRQYGLKEKFLPEETAYPHGGYTYQYFTGKVDYPFGFGLSYTTYAYKNVRVDKTAADANDNLTVSVDVTNTGKRAGSEVVQVYVAYPKGRGLPAKQIKGFAKVDLKPGETKTATMKVDLADCCFWDGAKRVVPNGTYTIEVGASSVDIKGRAQVKVTGALAKTVNVVTAKPSDVSVAVGRTMASGVVVSLKDDSFLSAGEARLAYKSSRPSVATVDAKGTVTGVAPGVATISVTATYNGSSKTATFPVAVVPAEGVTTGPVKPIRRIVPLKPIVKDTSKVDREALEAAIRIKVRGDDYDPASLAAYEKGLQRARKTFFDPKATQADVDAALKDLLAVKGNLRDFRHLVADFRQANKTWPFDRGRTVWVNWSGAKNQQDRDEVVDLTNHDPTKLELRFTVTLTPSDYETTFADAVAEGGFIKLRSVNVGQKDNDPDLQIFGGTLTANDEHNYGWPSADYIRSWGTTDVVVPLAQLNPDGKVGLPFVDKGFKADGKKRYSRGKIDWTHIEKFFMGINFKDKFKKTTSVTTKIANCRIVDVTIEEEHERLAAYLAEKTGPTSCGCPIKEEAYKKAVAAAKAAMELDNVVAVRRAVKDFLFARQDAGVPVTTDKDALTALVKGRIKDLSSFTPATGAAYADAIRAAELLLGNPKAKQLDVNRAVRALEAARKGLERVRATPRPLAKLLDEKSVESHFLGVALSADLDLSAEAEYTAMVRYQVKFEPTHAKKPANNKWLGLLVNGWVKAWGDVAEKNDRTAQRLASLSCARDSALASYSRPGEWMTLCHEIPVAKLAGGKLTQLKLGLFNDTGKYQPEQEDGINWNNDTGVRMTIRNVEILTDRPE